MNMTNGLYRYLAAGLFSVLLAGAGCRAKEPASADSTSTSGPVSTVAASTRHQPEPAPAPLPAAESTPPAQARAETADGSARVVVDSLRHDERGRPMGDSIGYVEGTENARSSTRSEDARANRASRPIRQAKRSAGKPAAVRPVAVGSADALPKELARPGVPHAASAPYWKGEKRNLVLITMDTTRADHIGAYGKIQGLTPNIDKLAGAGALFLNALSQTNQTNPSHVSVMTGLMGIEHGILDNQTKLEKDVDSLPEAFKRAGYHTAGFPSCLHVSAWLGWRGFDEIDEIPTKVFLTAEQITDKTIAWLDGNGDKPFFIWVHYWDPHAPYNPPKAFAEKFYTGNQKAPGKLIRSYEPIKKHGWLRGVTDMKYPPAMYKAEINYADSQIGRLLAYLDKKGLTAKTGVVLAGDHGENLGEHEMYYNHYFTFEPTLRIPIIMRMPGMPKGTKVEEKITQVDIAPTIAELYGLELDNPMRGISLVPSLEGKANPTLADRHVFVHEHGNNRQIVIRDGDFKIIYTITPFTTHPPLEVEAGEVWIYNLADDPGEKKNLVKEYPQLEAKYRRYVGQWFKLKYANRKKPTKLSPEIREQLGELGYLENEEDDTEAPLSGQMKPRPADKSHPAAGGDGQSKAQPSKKNTNKKPKGDKKTGTKKGADKDKDKDRAPSGKGGD